MARKFLIDTDTASDDAVALIMALRWPDVEVAAITVVAGNVPLEQGVRNALYTAELCGSSAPVYKGAAYPLLRPYASAQWFHGKDGLGDQGYPAPKRQPEGKHAVDAMIDTIKANPGIVVVTLGPLTNVALAVARAPEIAANVSRCVVMGGNACVVGNVTPAAEYNIWVDPDAARMVFHSGLPVEMIGWEHCRHESLLNDAEMTMVRGFDTPLAHFTLDCNATALQAGYKQSGEWGLALPDPVAMAVALDVTIATEMTEHYVEVETHSDLTRGMTVVDQLGVTHDERNRAIWAAARAHPPIKVCWQIDATRWKEALYSVLR
ncbi:MAG: nucleoside hydrolase [Chloroflexi bacterium]|nr:nucleoside hydrolase [Chloroflexota bacterium]